MHKSVLWAEDLEGHRQPSLYYLSEEDDGGIEGPHLICDWNGPPTDFGEIDFDSLGLLKKQQDQTNHDRNKDEDSIDQSDSNEEEFVDYPNPVADLVKQSNGGQLLTQTQRQNDYDLAECAHLNFLSVPPITQGLLRHIVKSIKNVKVQQERQKELHAPDKETIKPCKT